MKYNSITTESINELMEIFYTRVRNDKSGLGDIFNGKVGTGDEEWKRHKAKIANFWRGMLLNEGDYQGQPMKAHVELPAFPRERFDTWLSLFRESLDSIYSSDTADYFYEQARGIATRFQYVLYGGAA